MDFVWTTKQREARDRVAVYLDEAERARLRSAEDEDAAGLREITLHVQRRLVEAGALGISATTSSEKATLSRLAVDLELARTSAAFLLAVQATRQSAGWWPSTARSGCWPRSWGRCTRESDRGGGSARPGGSADGTPVATLQEDGSWRIRGKRSWVANAPIADRLAVFVADGARTRSPSSAATSRAFASASGCASSAWTGWSLPPST